MISANGDTAAQLGCRPGRPLPVALQWLLAAGSLATGTGVLPPGEPRRVSRSEPPVTAFVVPGWPGPHTLFLRAAAAAALARVLG